MPGMSMLSTSCIQAGPIPRNAQQLTLYLPLQGAQRIERHGWASSNPEHLPDPGREAAAQGCRWELKAAYLAPSVLASYLGDL